MRAREGRVIDLEPPELEVLEVSFDASGSQDWISRAEHFLNAPRREVNHVTLDGTGIDLWQAGSYERCRGNLELHQIDDLAEAIYRRAADAIDIARADAQRRFNDFDAVPNAHELRETSWPAILRSLPEVPVRTLADVRKFVPTLRKMSFGEVKELLDGPGVPLGCYYTIELAELRRRFALPGVEVGYAGR